MNLHGYKQSYKRIVESLKVEQRKLKEEDLSYCQAKHLRLEMARQRCKKKINELRRPVKKKP